MAARHHRQNHDVEQTKKIAPSITREAPCSQHDCELVVGVNIFDLDLGVQVDSVKQTILRDFVGSGHVSQHRTSNFDDHLDYYFVVVTGSRFDNCSTFRLPSLLNLTFEVRKQFPAAPLALPSFAEFFWWFVAFGGV